MWQFFALEIDDNNFDNILSSRAQKVKSKKYELDINQNEKIKRLKGILKKKITSGHIEIFL